MLWSGSVVLIALRLLQRWQHAVKPDIGSESRFLPTPPACRNSTMPFGTENSNGMEPDGEIFLKICLFFSTECTNVTDTRHTTRFTVIAYKIDSAYGQEYWLVSVPFSGNSPPRGSDRVRVRTPCRGSDRFRPWVVGLLGSRVWFSHYFSASFQFAL